MFVASSNAAVFIPMVKMRLFLAFCLLAAFSCMSLILLPGEAFAKESSNKQSVKATKVAQVAGKRIKGAKVRARGSASFPASRGFCARYGLRLAMVALRL